jgi:low affinity Fe/Cu permease
MSAHPLRPAITSLGSLSANAWVIWIVPIYAAFWFFFEHETFDWHAVATLATWLMTLFIQRSEHRDTQAIHVKLDEILHTQRGSDNSLTKIDDAEPEDIERRREQERSGD